MKKFVFAVMALVAMMASAGAQNFKVKGSVRDAKTGEALPFVNVGLMRTTDTVFVRGAATDMQGRFVIEDVKSGDYLMQVSCVGYEGYTKELKVVKDVNDLKVELRGGTLLETVEISAEKPLYVMDGEKNMYNASEDPSIQTGTASDALQNAPGVEVDAEGNITLRGVSSVEIWVNDRPSHMNEEALKQYIKQMPANAIERIEVITNPSARYSTSGGVINIVTSQKITRNELLCVGVRATTTPAISPWVSYVWANEKVDFNFYLNANYATHDMDADGTSTLYAPNGDTSRYQSFKTESRNPNVGGYVGFNMNWNIDSVTHLSAWLGAYPGWSWGHGQSDYIYREYNLAGGTPAYQDLSYFDTVRDHNFWGGGYAGAWFEHRYDTTGRKLSLTFNGNLWSSDGDNERWRRYSSIASKNFDRKGSSFYFGPSASIGANYTLSLKNNFEMEMGVEMGYSHNVTEQGLDSLAGTTWNNMGLRSYRAEGNGWSPEAYVTVQKRWGGFTAKLGLRAESTIMGGTLKHNSDVTALEIDTAFFGLVPSIHLSYQTQNFTSYSLSYTLRFSDPSDLADLTNLFRIYDDYSYSTGNPNLLRAYTHNFEAAWNKYLMGFGNIGLNAYVRANTNERGTMTSTDTDPNIGAYLVNYSYPVNIGMSHTEGIEANITYRPTGFFNIRFNASVFNYGYDYDGDKDSRVSWSARVNLWAKLWEKLEVFVNARYTSPRLGLYSLSNAQKSIDFGVSSDFFDRQLSLFLNVNDIFGWSEWGSNTTAPSYQTTGSTRFNSRFVSVGLTWRIGKMELESKARQGATDTPQM